METTRRILVPVDFSEPSRVALEQACRMAAELPGSVIELLHVVEPPVSLPGGGLAASGGLYYMTGQRAFRDAQKQIDQVLASVAGRDRFDVHARVEPGYPTETILRVAEQSAFDLIVMGTHGRTGLRHLVMGSVAETVVRRAPCPVLTVRAPDPRVAHPPSVASAR